MELFIHLAATIGVLIGAAWHLASKLGKLDTSMVKGMGELKSDITRVETRLEPLTDLPERVAKLEVRVNQ